MPVNGPTHRCAVVDTRPAPAHDVRVRNGGRWGRVSVAAVATVVLLGSCAGEDAAVTSASSGAGAPQAPGKAAERGAGKQDEGAREPAKQQDEPARDRRAGQAHVVSRVIDGDTVELGDGRTVRLVGIDTPERGECGFDEATADLVRLVEGRSVRLTRTGEDTDRYGRLLRYVDVGGLDAGLRLIRTGRAIARYDSRDGYGFHPREPRYVAADRARPQRGCAPAPAPAGQAPAGAGCEAGYSPCVPVYPPDVDCADVDGPVAVRGSDPHGLDADGDGTGCDS